MNMEQDYYDDDCPCDNCERECDGWEAAFCCKLCEWHGGGDCDHCDPMDL